MDPVSAVGLAAAAVQFFEISLKAIALCLEIRNNPDSATEHNADLELFIQHTKQSRQELAGSPPPKTPKRIVEVVTKSIPIAEELQQLLEQVRGAGKSNISVAKNMFRAMKERKRVEKLENSLKTNQKILDQLLAKDTWSTVKELASLDHAQHYSNIDAQGQAILKDLAQLKFNTEGDDAPFAKKIMSVQTNLVKHLAEFDRTTNIRTNEATREVVNRLDKAELNRREQFQQERENQLRDTFLQSLHFPEIDERQSNVKDPAPGTFKWIFQMQISSDEDSSESDEEEVDYDELTDSEGSIGSNSEESMNLHRWDDFPYWLQYEDSVYWVSGKLGSGKSTLMAYIVEHHRTAEMLELWSKERRIRILTFFFWRAGNTLQKSIIGLFRSLLYQICREEPATIRPVLTELGLLRPGIDQPSLRVWTERNLTKAVSIALRSAATEAKFCIFIDGLDEFVGDYDELVNLILDLQELEAVKLCVSSRPEVELIRRLKRCRQLRMQDLNKEDIRKFVHQKFRDDGTHPDDVLTDELGDHIVRRSDGVFLWASLVTQSVLRGARSGDDTNMLQRRIETTPKEMDKIFRSMLSNIDAVHKSSLAFYLGIMELVKTLPNYYRQRSLLTSIATVTAARLQDSEIDWTTLAKSCEQTIAQIPAQSMGLLEIQQEDSYHFKMMPKIWRDSTERWIPVRTPPSGDWALERRDDSTYPKVLTYEHTFFSWIHRSAYDYFQHSDVFKELNIPKIPMKQLVKSLSWAALRYYRFAPMIPWPGESQFYFSSTLRRFFYLLQDYMSISPLDHDLSLKLTDQLRFVSAQAPHSQLTEDNFWWCCAWSDNWAYIVERVSQIDVNHALQVLRVLWDTGGSKLMKKFRIIVTASLLGLLRTVLNRIGFLRYEMPRSTYFHQIVTHPSNNLRLWPDLSFGFSYGVQSDKPNEDGWRLDHTVAAIFGLVLKRIWYTRDILMNDDLDNNERVLRILEDCQSIARSLNLYFEIGRSKHLSVQLLAHVAYEILQDQKKSSTMDSIPPALGQDVQAPYLQFLCCTSPFYIRPPLEAGKWNDYNRNIGIKQCFMFRPSLEVTQRLLQYLQIKPSERENHWEELEECYQLVEESIWRNEQNLNATDQLIVLACIRLYLREIFANSPSFDDITIHFDETDSEGDSDSSEEEDEASEEDQDTEEGRDYMDIY